MSCDALPLPAPLRKGQMVRWFLVGGRERDSERWEGRERGRGGEIRPCNLDTRVDERATGRFGGCEKCCRLHRKGFLWTDTNTMSILAQCVSGPCRLTDGYLLCRKQHISRNYAHQPFSEEMSGSSLNITSLMRQSSISFTIKPRNVHSYAAGFKQGYLSSIPQSDGKCHAKSHNRVPMLETPPFIRILKYMALMHLTSYAGMYLC